MKRFILLGLALSSVAAAVECPADLSLQPTITCSGFSVNIQPGKCTRFENPCGNGDWVDPSGSTVDVFAIAEAVRPDSVYVHTTAADGITTRSFCAAKNSPTIPGGIGIPFIYQRSGPQGTAFGTGAVTIRVASPLVVTASATPDQISVGEDSQLVATVSGGIAPYSYIWVPTSTLSANDLPRPRAAPNVTTTYTVHIIDASHGMTSADVTIGVNHVLTVTADPSVILLGAPLQLNASGAGGRLPYSFSWTPTETLNSSTRPNPRAIPSVTTTYTVTRTDADGVTRTDSAEVTVMLDANAPVPAAIEAGHATQLDVRPTGGDGVYTYLWSPATGLSDPTIRNPIASPAASAIYTVVVTDGHGQTVSHQVPVTVNLPNVSAAFTVTRVPAGSSVSVSLDASASIGNIVSYTWQFSLAIPIADIVTASPQTTLVVGEEAGRGSITLTVAGADGRTATTTRLYR